MSNHVNHLVSLARQARLELPGPVAAAVKDRAAVLDEYARQATEARSKDLAAALFTSMSKGANVFTDKALLPALVADAITRQGMAERVADVADGRLESTVIEHADEIHDALRAKFDEHAATITAAHDALGGVDLDAAQDIVARGGDAAQHYVDARAAIAALQPILGAVQALHRLTGRDLRPGADAIAEFTPEQWNSYTQRADRDPWAALNHGARLRLATPQEQAESRAAANHAAEMTALGRSNAERKAWARSTGLSMV